MSKFQLPAVAKPLPGQDPAADAFVRGGEAPLGAPAAPAQGRVPLELVPDQGLPKSFLLRLTREQAQLLELGFKKLPYKTRKDMVEDILFGELKRRVSVG
jgi:hypothetical protein